MEDEGMVIAGLLVGLNVIDCNLCIKEEDLDQPVSTKVFLTLFFQIPFLHSHFNSGSTELPTNQEDYFLMNLKYKGRKIKAFILNLPCWLI